MDGEQSNKQLIHVDIPNDASAVVIFLFPYIIMLILIPLSSYCSACEILRYIIFYLSYIALVLQDGTSIEVIDNKITINRFLFGPWVINKKDIILTEAKKNLLYTFRFPGYILMLIFLVYNINNVYYGIHRAMLNGYPAEELFILFLSRMTIIFLFCALFYIMINRLRIQKVLEIKTNGRKYKFYTQNPEEFEMLINRNREERENEWGK
ncbi:MAG: hypothetical protein RBT65_00050 [Methanolobus sp.]|nr:hypothetical protein [Methanolobus sp.]